MLPDTGDCFANPRSEQACLGSRIRVDRGAERDMCEDAPNRCHVQDDITLDVTSIGTSVLRFSNRGYAGGYVRAQSRGLPTCIVIRDSRTLALARGGQASMSAGVGVERIELGQAAIDDGKCVRGGHGCRARAFATMGLAQLGVPCRSAGAMIWPARQCSTRTGRGG